MTLVTAGARRRNADPWSQPTITPAQGTLPAPGYTIPTAAPYNVGPDGRCTTPTPDGTGSGVHPDVVDFGTAWNGYRFWMAFTPYYNEDVDEENPCILASDDGHTWEVPPGLTNPIYPAPSVRWNSDTDLAYDDTTGDLVLMYRDGYFRPCVARSSDGSTWLPATPTRATFAAGAYYEGLSHAILRLPSGLWAMWAVSSGLTGVRTLVRWTAPAPEGPWDDPTACTGIDATIWHHNIARIGTTLYAMGHEDNVLNIVYAYTSTDGIDWARNPVPIIQKGIAYAWDGTELYRGALQPHEDGTHMRVWYSGRPLQLVSGSWRIGLTHVPLSEWPAAP